MRIVIMYNPVSGAGHAAHAAEQALGALREGGHDGMTVASRLESTASWLDPTLVGADVLVIAGGDGAMRLAAPAACRSGTPVFHLPLGTENLFARQFNTLRGVETLIAALERPAIRRVDVAIANGRMFLLMASVGFDAEVVHTLAASRGGRISHLTYVKPILSTMRTWSPPRLSIDVDGQSQVDGKCGMVVVANSRQYGWRIDPAGHADMTDGLLDVVFMPVRSMIDVVGWVIACRSRRQFRRRGLVESRGRQVTIRSDQPQHYQLDGDPPGVIKELLPDGVASSGSAGDDRGEDSPLDLRISVCPARLAVLTPADGPQTS